jgi:hypothetical protein
MAFQDTDWIDLRAINLMFGRNSSGKSAIIRALLLLKQSVDASREFGPLILANEEGTDIGVYSDFVHAHDLKRDVIFSFKVDVDGEPVNEREYKPWGDAVGIVSPWAELHLSFGVTEADANRIILKKIQITALAAIRRPGEDQDSMLDATVFSASKSAAVTVPQWIYGSEVIPADFGSQDPVWGVVYPDFNEGFVPFLNAKDLVTNGKSESEFGDTFNFVANLLRLFREEIGDFLRAMHYLGPIRSEPQRFYYIPQLSGTGVGVHGQHVARAYLSASDEENERLDLLNDWLAYAGLNSRLVVRPLDERRSLYSVLLEETSDEAVNDDSRLTVNLRDVGFGASQALPVIIESLLADAGSLVIIEQPELHLHPAAQAEMGDLFIRAGQLGVRVLIETHSDNLIYRLRRRLAETAKAEKDEMPFTLSLHAPALAGYFVERHAGVSVCSRIEFDKWGRYTLQPPGFLDFFGSDYAELLALDEARQSALSEER